MKVFVCIKFILLIGLKAMSATQSDLQMATKAVNELLASSQISAQRTYCTPGKLDCRTHTFLADRSGRPLDAFFVSFVSADRQIGSTGYFLPVKNKPGWYHRFEDMAFDGKKIITEISTDVQIQKGHHAGHFRILNVRIPRLGTTRYVIANITAITNRTTIEGIEHDTNDPQHQVPVKIVYNYLNL